MDTTNKPKYEGILGIDERIQPVSNSSYKLQNWTIDPKSRGWDNRLGYESLVPNVEDRSNWAGFQNGGPVNSVYFWNTHQGAKSFLLYEQAYANSFTKVFPTDPNANMSLHYWKGNSLNKETIDAQRSRPAIDEVTTHYNPIGKNLVILSGNGKPIKFDGIKVYGLGFMETPNPPTPWTPNPTNAAGVSDQTVMPIQAHSFNMNKSYGLGSNTGGDANRYRWKVSFISADGSESPLSAPSIAISWTTATGVSATYDDKRQAVYLENVPIGPEGTIGRKLYRTKNLKEDDEEIYYYLDTIVNNLETNYVDYSKDTRLGALAPDDSASILFPAPSTRFSATFKNSLFIDGGQSEPQRIYFSQPLKVDQYRALDFFDVGSRAGGDVTGLFTYYNNLLVFRESAIDIIRGDAINGFTIAPLVQGIGTRALHTIALIPQKGVVFLSTEGIFLISGGFDGGSQISVDKISEPIIDTVGRLNKAGIAKACGAYSEKWREYHVYFQISGGLPAMPNPSATTLGLVLHMDKMSWSERRGFPVGCITVDARGEFIFGHNVGQTTPAPVTLFGLAPDETGLFFISRDRNAGHGYTYNPPVLQNPAFYTIQKKGPLTSVWISANQNFGSSSAKKYVKNVYLNCFTEGSNTYNVFYNKDWDFDYTQSNFGLGQRPEYVEQAFYDADTNIFVYGPASTPLIVPTWQLPLYTQLKFPIANAACSTFSVGIQTTNDIILIDYELEFNTNGTETKAARPRSAY